MQLSAHARARGVKTIAVLEASKGLLVLLVGFELLHLVHRDLQAIAEGIVRWGRLNPAHHYPRIFVEVASRTTDAHLKTLAALGFAYSAVRFVEAYGLWHLRSWAESLAVISGTIYVPLEILEIARGVTAFRVAAFLANVAIVAYLLYVRLAEADVAILRRARDPVAGASEPSPTSTSPVTISVVDRPIDEDVRAGKLWRGIEFADVGGCRKIRDCWKSTLR